VVLAPGANIEQNPDGSVTGTDAAGTEGLDASRDLDVSLLRDLPIVGFAGIFQPLRRRHA
jgi:hypothetical protein